MQPGGNFPRGAQAVRDGGLPVFRAGFEPVLRVVLQFAVANLGEAGAGAADMRAARSLIGCGAQ
jgi:hypothetical protein